jgi:hexosaminidase
MDSEQKAEYMMFPRMMALAEIAWSVKENRDYSNFLDRLRHQAILLEKLKIHAANTFDEITYRIEKRKDGKTGVGLYTTLPNSIIRYTTDGSDPGKTSALYQDFLVINNDQMIKLLSFKMVCSTADFQKVFVPQDGDEAVEVFNQKILTPEIRQHLVNGIEGSNRYNDGQWFGFSGVNLEAVIDLGSSKASFDGHEYS